MARKTKSDPTAWRTSPAGTASYRTARASAQETADRLGVDVGLEANDLFKSWHAFTLPAVKYRRGHELRCEVVSPSSLDKCLPGHGPYVEVPCGWVGGRS